MATINNIRKEMLNKFLGDPELLRKKRPFTRGGDRARKNRSMIQDLKTETVQRPIMNKKIITQQEYLEELDPAYHKVLFDENVPHICIKTNDGQYRDIEHRKMALPYQKNIKDKKVLHLCANPMKDFITMKQYWSLRNMEGMKTKIVDTQLSFGDAGLLYYLDYKDEIKCRLISYLEGYTICSHNDPNGDRLVESIYYVDDEDREIIDSYTDTTHYRLINKRDIDNGEEKNRWVLEFQEPHGFSEIPLITKRGEVAWERAQGLIEVLEVMWNTFTVVQKRHGWGILYVTGNFKPLEKSIAGNMILQDTSINGKGSAEFKTPPNPENMIEFLKELKYEIQTASATTFILPQDIKMSGDVSALAIQLSQSLDNENALQSVIEWQNVASKMCRLFKEGLGMELVNKGIDTSAATRFAKLDVNAKFTIWLPKSESDFNQMLATLHGAGGISLQTLVESNTQSKPDELHRIKIEEAEAAQAELEATIATNEATVNISSSEGEEEVDYTETDETN